MKHVLTVPPTLDDRAFDALVEAAAGDSEGEQGSGVLIDARHVRWADPYGMTGLLALGHHLTAEGAFDAAALADVESALAGDTNVDGLLPLLDARASIVNAAKQLAEPGIILSGMTPRASRHSAA